MVDKKIFNGALTNAMKALEHELKTIDKKICALDDHMTEQEMEFVESEDENSFKNSEYDKDMEELRKLHKKQDVFYFAITELRSLYCGDRTSSEGLVLKTIITAVLETKDQNN